MEMETETIKKNNFPHPSMDFFGLRNSAIEYLQKLAGDEWTDFNEHDPGVTILDQLCYAITDLSYRTDYDIRDLLAGKPEFSGRVKDPQNPDRDISHDSFFTLNEVMPSHPLTITDWRKLFIDKVDNARNVWVEPFGEDHKHPVGLYRILVEVNHLVKEEDHPAMIDAITKVFHEYRNLCEDLESVQILKKREVKIIASVEVNEYMDSEEILADIFFNIEKFLSHPIRMYTLPQMLEKGYTIGSIFNSPRLDNGFILDEALYPRITQIYYSRLIRVILEVPGVKNVYNFSIEGADEKNKTFVLGDMEVPVFNLHSSTSKGEFGIKVLKNRIPVYIEHNVVHSFFQAFKLGQPKSFVPGQHQQSLRAFDVKLGRDRKVGEYRSVQYDFPPIYGIGEYGVGDDAFISADGSGRKRSSARRIGLAQQLKGYLLVFDQVLANYLQQLASVPELFSIDPNIKRTYFPAMRLDVPRLKPLQKGKDGNDHVDYEAKVMQRAQLMFSHKFDYHEALDNIVTSQDDFYRRRNEFLDHLLARFGVSIPSRTFEDTNWYFTTEKELQEFILATKAAALQYIDLITEKRGQAPILPNETVISWLEVYIQVRLGIVDSKMNFRLQFSKLAEPLFRHRVLLPEKPQRKHGRKAKQKIKSPHGKIEDKEAENFDVYDLAEKEEDRELFRSFSFYRKLISKQLHIDLDMLRNGYTASNYRFAYTGENKVTVIYRDPEDHAAEDDRSWKIVGVFDRINEAITGILGLSSFIRYLNIETEGLHLVEHLPLRPPTSKLKFETQLLDNNREVLLQSDMPFSCEDDQEQIIKKFFAAGCRPASYHIKKDKSGHWSIELVDDDEKIIARAINHYHGEREAKANAEHIMERCMEVFHKEHDHTESFRFRTLYSGEEIPLLSFYSFGISVIMPSWTARFTNQGFRKTVSMLLRNHAPAHCSIAEFWLEPEEMLEFENLYRQWRKAYAGKDPVAESLGIKLGILINQYYFADSN
jgi:hypothetical protein